MQYASAARESVSLGLKSGTIICEALSEFSRPAVIVEDEMEVGTTTQGTIRSVRCGGCPAIVGYHYSVDWHVAAARGLFSLPLAGLTRRDHAVVDGQSSSVLLNNVIDSLRSVVTKLDRSDASCTEASALQAENYALRAALAAAQSAQPPPQPDRLDADAATIATLRAEVESLKKDRNRAVDKASANAKRCSELQARAWNEHNTIQLIINSYNK